MREFRTYGSVRGALSNERPYRDSRPQRAGWKPAVPGRATARENAKRAAAGAGGAFFIGGDAL